MAAHLMRVNVFGLGPQLHVHGGDHGPLDPHKVNAPRKRGSSAGQKPHGGIWTSTYQGGTSAWVTWCEEEMPEWVLGRDRWLLTPEPDAVLAVVDTYSDLAALMKVYAAPVHSYYADPPNELDWPRMAQDGIAGMHLTDRGQWATRLTLPYSLYGWDCESTVWFRWAFTDWSLLIPEWPMGPYREPAALVEP